MNYGNPIITDTANWVKISGIYKAQGGEKYITIGNFFADSNTKIVVTSPTGVPQAAYLLDDVSVIPLDSFCLKADAGKDTTITIGDSIFIGSYTNGIDSVKWLLGSTVIDSVQPGFWVKPTITTSYVLHQIVNGCFSSDTVTITVQPLPLKFTSYSVSLRGTKQSVENVWTTASEVNVSHYNIIKSIDGRNFMTIGKVKTNNKSSNEYSFIDEQAFDGVNYYRIVGVDNDGKMNYSEVKSVSINEKKRYAIFPNPAVDELYVKGKQIVKISITDARGKTCLQQVESGSPLAHINVSALPTGLYVVQVWQKNGSVSTQKLIKQ
jgi:hypothetical protein